ncbi:helix-turn-helix transcriptional regulator [Hyphobacterium sp. CCMP332]|nr:helix-turn-helix transcriptional regulator [Hyphobacterium sp. CCMP332]
MTFNKAFEATTNKSLLGENAISHKLTRLHRQEEFRKKYISRFNALSVRELQVLNLIIRDYNNPQIAKKLFISRNTVEQHRKNIKKKLRFKGHFELLQYALAFDLI